MIVTSKEVVTFNEKTGVIFIDFACENAGDTAEDVVRDLFLPQEISFNQCVGVAVAAAVAKVSPFKVTVPASESWGLAIMNTNLDAPIVLGGAFSRPFNMGSSGSAQARFSMNMVRRYMTPYTGRAKVRLAFNLPPKCSLAVTAVADVIK